MTVEIITPAKILCKVDNVTKLKAPGICGDFGVWKNHASFVTMLGDGQVTYTIEEEGTTKEECYKIKDGFFGVINNRITILADQGEKIEN